MHLSPYSMRLRWRLQKAQEGLNGGFERPQVVPWRLREAFRRLQVAPWRRLVYCRKQKKSNEIWKSYEIGKSKFSGSWKFRILKSIEIFRILKISNMLFDWNLQDPENFDWFFKSKFSGSWKFRSILEFEIFRILKNWIFCFFCYFRFQDCVWFNFIDYDAVKSDMQGSVLAYICVCRVMMTRITWIFAPRNHLCAALCIQCIQRHLLRFAPHLSG